jgi:hypothetical protein
VIAGVAVLPAAPMLVAGVSAALPDAAAACLAAIRRVVGGLAHADAAVLLVAGDALDYGSATAVSLEGYGRPDLRLALTPAADATRLLSGLASDLAAVGTGPGLLGTPAAGDEAVRDRVPGAAAVLALQVGGRWPVCWVEMPRGAAFAALAGVGEELVERTAAGRYVVVAQGDLSAGLRADSPRPGIPGAAMWDEHAVGAIDASRLEALGKLGPEEAARVHALGWAPLATLAGICRAARLATVVRHYSAPRGVGYVVAQGG